MTKDIKFDDAPEWVKKLYNRFNEPTHRPKHLRFQPYEWVCDRCHFKNSQMVYRDAEWPNSPFMSQGPMQCSVCGTIPGILRDEDGKVMANEEDNYAEFNKTQESREQCTTCGCPIRGPDGRPIKGCRENGKELLCDECYDGGYQNGVLDKTKFNKDRCQAYLDAHNCTLMCPNCTSKPSLLGTAATKKGSR